MLCKRLVALETYLFRRVSPALAGLIVFAASCFPHALRAQLFVAGYNGGRGSDHVLKASTMGAFVNGSFVTGLSDPTGVAIRGHTLYVLSANKIGTYDAITGATINPALVTGLAPTATGLAISAAELYVATGNDQTMGDGKVQLYNADSGALINPALITGLNSPFKIALSAGRLFVTTDSNSGQGRVQVFTTSGSLISSAFVTGFGNPTGVAVSGDGNYLFVADFLKDQVGKYDAATGTAINPALISGLNGPTGITVYGQTLFVTSRFSNQVGKYSLTGADLGARLIDINSPADVAAAADQPPSGIEIARLLTNRHILLRFVLQPNSAATISAASGVNSQFTPLVSTTADPNGDLQYEDVNSLSFPRRFYHVSSP